MSSHSSWSSILSIKYSTSTWSVGTRPAFLRSFWTTMNHRCGHHIAALRCQRQRVWHNGQNNTIVSTLHPRTCDQQVYPSSRSIDNLNSIRRVSPNNLPILCVMVYKYAIKPGAQVIGNGSVEDHAMQFTFICR